MFIFGNGIIPPFW